MELRILTLNLKGVESAWFERRRSLLLEQLQGWELDVLALQEVAILKKPFYHQALDLGIRLGLPSLVYAPYGNPAEVHSEEQGGVALLSRWPLQLVENRHLPPGQRHPDNRVAILATVMQPPRALHMAVTHLSWPPEDAFRRARQLDAILARARDYGWLEPPERFVLAGDLNAPPDEAGIAEVAKLLQDAWQHANPQLDGHTWSQANPLTGNYSMPDRRLDYLFVDARATIARVQLRFDDPARGFVSDHFGLMADLCWEDRLGP